MQFGGLLLQNAALMHFPASEVVPIYFCMFALAGVAGSGFAYGELRWPWVLMLFPGVALCILGVFAISHRREERIARRLALQYDSAYYDPPPTCADVAAPRSFATHPGGTPSDTPRSASARRESSERSESSGDVQTRSGLASGSGGLASNGGPYAVRGLSAVDLGPCRVSSTRVSVVSEACSVCSVASQASLEEAAFMAIGGGSFTSIAASARMAAALPTGRASPSGSASSLPHLVASTPSLTPPQGRPISLGLSGHLCGGEPGGVRQALLPRCSEAASSTSASDIEDARRQYTMAQRRGGSPSSSGG